MLHLRQSFGFRASPFVVVLMVLLTVQVSLAGEPRLGSADFRASPQQPVGWRGDGTGQYPDAQPPLHWNRSCRQMSDLRCAAAIPKDGSASGAVSAAQGFFTRWLVAVPVITDDPGKAIKETTPEEATLAPGEGDKLSDATWQLDNVEDSILDIWDVHGKMTRGQVAYAQACLYVDTPTQIRFQYNHADGAAFWFNGSLKHNDSVFAQGLSSMGPTLLLDLRKGWNRFLFKITPRTGKSSDWPSACFVRAHFWLAQERRDSEQQNITWITPMPGLSNAMPIIVGERIFTTAHPYNLVCVDKKDGRILWIRTNSPYDAATAEERRAKPDYFTKMDELAAARDAYYRDYVAGKRPDDAAVKAQKGREDQLDALMLEVNSEKYGKPNEQGEGHRNWWEIPTPVSDGNNVCLWLTRGVSACYDVEGNRRWIEYQKPRHQHHGFFGSPAIADGKLFFMDGTISARDLGNGSIKHSIGLEKLKDWQCWYGSFTRTTIAGAEYIVCPTGRTLLRARDGQVLGPGAPGNHDSTPLFQDGLIVHTSQSDLGIWSVKPAADGGVDFSEPKHVKWPTNRRVVPGLYCGGWLEASPLVHDGLGYVVSYSGVLFVFDVATLEVVYQKQLSLDQLDGGGWSGFAASPTLAGGYVYLMGPTGITLIIKPGRQYEEVARNRIQFLSRAGRCLGANDYFLYNTPYCPEYQENTMTSTPVFDGRRMYLHGLENLYCIGE